MPKLYFEWLEEAVAWLERERGPRGHELEALGSCGAAAATAVATPRAPSASKNSAASGRWSLAPLVPADRRFRRAFRGRGELIDHVLVRHALVRRIERSDTGSGEPRSITEDPTVRRDERASDHLAVVARFRLGGKGVCEVASGRSGR